jgi:hypothetical protein
MSHSSTISTLGLASQSQGLGVDATADQEKANEAAKQQMQAIKNKIKQQIIEINNALDEKEKELGIKHASTNDPNKKREFENDYEAFSEDSREKLNELYSQLDSDDEPLPVKVFSSIWDLIKLKLENIWKSAELKPDVKNAQLNLIDILQKNITQMKDDNVTLDPIQGQQISDLLVSLSDNIQSKSSSSSSSPSPSLLSSLSSAGAAAGPGTGAGEGEGEGASAGAGAGAEEEAGKGPGTGAAAPEHLQEHLQEHSQAPKNSLLQNFLNLGTRLTPEFTPEQEKKYPKLAGFAKSILNSKPLAIAAGGGQKGGGISRKRSHPKYINEISENRNKIFKKELEIINSIRRFHRSHTIRKRDKINNILGLRKSRNNRNNMNHGNTKRNRHEHPYKHRHNTHKHKSAKHIKK